MNGLGHFQRRAGCNPTAIFNQYQEHIVSLGNCKTNATLRGAILATLSSVLVMIFLIAQAHFF